MNGWGIREMAAVAMLGPIGIPAPDALAASVLCGLCVTAVTLGAAALVAAKTPSGAKETQVGAFSGMALRPAEIEKAAAWILGTLTAALVFFQVHVEFLGATINLNFADPFAILALAAVAAHAVMTRHPPAWRVGHANLALLLISALLVFGFLNGVWRVGVTQWALTARLLGWLVLLGYLCAGYLMLANAGAHGRRRLFETMIATGAAVVALQILLRLLGPAEYLHRLLPHARSSRATPPTATPLLFRCWSAPCCCLATLRCRRDFATLLRSAWHVQARERSDSRDNPAHTRTARPWLHSLLLSVILAGLLFSASRAGLITCAVLMVGRGLTGLADRRVIAQGAIAAILIWQSPQIAQWVLSLLGWVASYFDVRLAFEPSGAIQGPPSPEMSNIDRWRSIIGGLQLVVRPTPLLGPGLVVFIENNRDSSGDPLVIHNTPVWLLVEFGLLGAGIFGWFFLLLGRHALEKGTRSPQRRVVAMLLLSFAIFSLVHEILYQRIFWLVLGATLASLRKEEG